jgi:hypothetical protein
MQLHGKPAIISSNYLQARTINILCDSLSFYLNIGTLDLMSSVAMNDILMINKELISSALMISMQVH